MSKSPLLIFILSAAVVVGLISTPASANANNSQCRFNGEFKGKVGQQSACIWSDVGEGKWIKFPKRNIERFKNFIRVAHFLQSRIPTFLVRICQQSSNPGM
jgi:hypothetical protein